MNCPPRTRAPKGAASSYEFRGRSVTCALLRDAIVLAVQRAHLGLAICLPRIGAISMRSQKFPMRTGVLAFSEFSFVACWAYEPHLRGAAWRAVVEDNRVIDRPRQTRTVCRSSKISGPDLELFYSQCTVFIIPAACTALAGVPRA